ncbi:MAG: Acyl carrier protein phosphodiesterase [Flavobacteriaceae bacterium]|nr:MAG: Acyl carrier protein phosphodiesterase [Flavobacteriaceae bacterium]
MNYLAHIYLSGSSVLHSVGNFIADDVKGSDWKNYPKAIQDGITLHRAIDSFTDNHILFKKHVRLLFPKYRHYSRVIVDMYYDHLLAHHWSRYHPLSLNRFAQKFYNDLKKYLNLLPKGYNQRILIIKRENWLLKYKSKESLKDVLKQMESRTQFPSNLSESTEELTLHWDLLSQDFKIFFKDLCVFCKSHPKSGVYQELPYFKDLNSVL